ncbi:MAG: SDR family NAD(P)-dependent oxidoreductase [Coriobacteriales bacterium]|jgi:NAD(P)-dependent dehydrogenase (short-subunit alcohol dehydrogenase family)
MGNWFVTGASSGIGRGVVSAALEAGNNVVATARNTASLHDLEDSSSGNLLILKLDVTDAIARKSAVEEAEKRFGSIDVLVNNAGYGYRAAVEESDREQVDRLFETNFFGPAALMNLVLPGMRASHSGTIVNVTSMGAVRAAVGNAYYSASKAALEMVSDGLRKESEHLGIRVMMVEPGAFRTRFYDSLVGSDRIISGYDQSVGAMRIHPGDDIPHNQMGDPAKAGKVIVDVVSGDKLPERLVLGSDAHNVLVKEYERRLKELEDSQVLSSSTDFD